MHSWGFSQLFKEVDRRASRILAEGAAGLVRRGLVGLERECLRVTPEASLALTPHPPGLGSALTHPHLTTDFSEALLELVTPPFEDKARVLGFLQDTQGFVYRHLGEELLWSASMPCLLGGEAEIPLAYYGPSNAGRMKTLYRKGLGYRYGRTMQTIAGVHFNYSLAEALWPVLQGIEEDRGDLGTFVSESYLRLIRNLQRYGWLLAYLFGASPVVSKTFLEGHPTDLVPLGPDTYGHPDATSLRLGDIGYQNRLEEGKGLKANYDSLDAYIRSLTWAIETPCPQYEAIGVKVDGDYRQLNANVLQIENEYYSTVRPKQILEGFEKPTRALRRRGVRYVEVRSLDVDPFVPLGVSLDQLLFVEAFVIFCLLADSPRINGTERPAIDRNQTLTAHRGRSADLELERGRRPVRLRHWAEELLSAMAPVLGLLDGEGEAYRRSWIAQQAKVQAPELTPSERLLAALGTSGEGFVELALDLSARHRDHFQQRPLNGARIAFFEGLARESLERQRALETGDTRDFDQFLADYFAVRAASPEVV